MSEMSVKESVKVLIESLPDDLTWDQLMHEIYVRQAIEAGLADSQAGRTTDVGGVRKAFGLSQ